MRVEDQSAQLLRENGDKMNAKHVLVFLKEESIVTQIYLGFQRFLDGF